jgi:hypothetical protein
MEKMLIQTLKRQDFVQKIFYLKYFAKYGPDLDPEPEPELFRNKWFRIHNIVLLVPNPLLKFKDPDPSYEVRNRTQYLKFTFRVFWQLLCLCRPFVIVERCLYSNPDCCRIKQARNQLSHPSL